MHITWDDIHTVESLVRTGTVVAAARELALQHSSISRRIDALEQALGAPLFLRGARLRPTALALSIADRAKGMAAQAAEIGALVEADRRSREGRLVLTTNDALASLAFEALAREGLGRHLDVRVTDREATLEPGITDLALRPGTRPQGDRRGWRLGRLRIAVYRARTQTTDDWILPAPELRARTSMRWWKAVPDDAPSRLTCDSLLAIRDACAAGLGRAVLPAALALGHDHLVADREQEPGPPVWLLSAATRRADKALREAGERLAAAIRAIDGIWA